MNAQALILDIFDDGGALLVRDFPDPDALPEVVKTAEATERDQHTAGEFALVLADEHDVLPRFLIATPGHTALSVLYFGKTRGHLPEEAQKVAASRLAMACAHHGLGTPALLEEIADGLQAGDPRVYVGSREVTKHAEAPAEARTVAFALGDRYPLGSAAEVKAAVRYFSDHLRQFTPEDRHEYAVNVANACEVAGLPVSEDLAKHAGVDWNRSLSTHILVRKQILAENEAPLDQSVTLEKLASHRGQVDPSEFAAALATFDRRTGLDRFWGRDLFDPYEATFEKRAAKKDRQREWTVTEADTLTEEDMLAGLNRVRTMQTVAALMGSDFADRLQRDPVATFNAATPRLKIVLARILTDRRDVP